VSTLRRERSRWIVNDSIDAAMLVGAGGHFCSVARWLNPVIDRRPLVAAQEAEFPLDDRGAGAIVPETPELYFCRDLKGYGWCFRKGGYLNVGIGRIDGGSLTKARDEFLGFLRARRRLPPSVPCDWRGHAYLVSNPPRRRVVDESLVLAGDAAGLAYPESGEGIRPAIESGLLAASTIVRAGGRYTRERLASYAREVEDRFGTRHSGAIPPAVAKVVAPSLFHLPWFVRHLVLDRWFLHAEVPALVETR
jgi:flavin-dependent dehydrogenase